MKDTETPAPRRAYEAPKIASSEAFERLALACNGNTIPGRCKIGASGCSPGPGDGFCNSVGAS